ncbi:IclR family transcriptional regulator [Streptomyces sp. NPDC102340]|uniref:IclR family transcriptional regulator n=1 Tax=unclassified Streptomyces TaxID=2593676 RepID=UPI0037F9F1A6
MLTSPERGVLGRAAVIMAAFDSGRQVIGLRELSAHTGLPKSTLHRLAEQLCQVGWMERDPEGYRLGIRLFELGSMAAEANRLQEAALPHLQALAGRTGMSAQLGILDRAEVVYLERVVTGSFHLPTRRGGRKPAYCTALGKALTAYDEEAVQTVTSARMQRKTARTITEPAALRAEFDKVRRAGVAFDHGEAYAELVCVAAPIRADGTRGDEPTIGAVSVTGPAGRMRWGAVADAVHTAAAAIWVSSTTCGGGGGRHLRSGRGRGRG